MDGALWLEFSATFAACAMLPSLPVGLSVMVGVLMVAPNVGYVATLSRRFRKWKQTAAPIVVDGPMQ